MTRTVLLAAAAAVFLTLPATSQPPRANSRPKSSPTTGPQLVPLAETKLLMEGIAHANFLGLEKILRPGEVDAESWTFARGQALLIAESGNLLLLRPPKNTGESAWMKSAGDMRDLAGQLAKTLATRDLERSRAGLVELSHGCNACHDTFRVATRVKAFAANKP